MRYEDWGDRCPRWAGVRSVLTSVAGVPVHYLVGDPTGPVNDAPTHVLVPPMTASAAGWADLVAAMRELGPVVSADPPGTLAGHTGAPYRRASMVGGDPELVSREQVAVYGEQLQGLDPRRLAGTITAFASATAAMFVDQQSTLQLLDRVTVPVLLLWGTDVPLIDQPSHRLHAQRPGWTPHPFDGAGHLLPVERPDEYVAAVRAWMASTSP